MRPVSCLRHLTSDDYKLALCVIMITSIFLPFPTLFIALIISDIACVVSMTSLFDAILGVLPGPSRLVFLF